LNDYDGYIICIIVYIRSGYIIYVQSSRLYLQYQVPYKEIKGGNFVTYSDANGLFYVYKRVKFSYIKYIILISTCLFSKRVRLKFDPAI